MVSPLHQARTRTQPMAEMERPIVRVSRGGHERVGSDQRQSLESHDNKQRGRQLNQAAPIWCAGRPRAIWRAPLQLAGSAIGPARFRYIPHRFWEGSGSRTFPEPVYFFSLFFLPVFSLFLFFIFYFLFYVSFSFYFINFSVSFYFYFSRTTLKYVNIFINSRTFF